MRLTSGPLHLLVAMARGAVLRETTRRGRTWFSLFRPRREGSEQLHARAVNTLRQLALIERQDEFDWLVSESGHAWLARNGIEAIGQRCAVTRHSSGEVTGGVEEMGITGDGVTCNAPRHRTVQ